MLGIVIGGREGCAVGERVEEGRGVQGDGVQVVKGGGLGGAIVNEIGMAIGERAEGFIPLGARHAKIVVARFGVVIVRDGGDVGGEFDADAFGARIVEFGGGRAGGG